MGGAGETAATSTATAAEEEDDLQINSIGSLYSGPWEKKYWSSSRGKDRYPYPIGYGATRNHCGSSYRMEILEGNKGPLFVVTSTSSDSCSGQTPSIAWESLLKKSGHRANGKRLSSKIDGVQLFGFRNSYVQRLLRELVANICLSAQHSLSHHCHDNLRNHHDEHIHLHPDLVSYLGKGHTTKKRSVMVMEQRNRRMRCQGLSSTVNADLSIHGSKYSSKKGKDMTHFQEKELPSPTSVSITGFDMAKMSQLVSGYQNNSKHIKTTGSPKIEKGEDKVASSLPTEVSSLAVENCSSFPSNNRALLHKDIELFVEKHVIFQEQSKFTACGDSKANDMGNMVCQAFGVQVGRSPDAEQQETNASLAPMGKDEEHSDLVGGANFCAPDSMDSSNGQNRDIDVNKESPCNTKDRLMEVNPLDATSIHSIVEVITEDLPKQVVDEISASPSNCIDKILDQPLDSLGSALDNGPCKSISDDSFTDLSLTSGSSNASNGKIDLDVGQDLANSMMAFLLPQALPLLKKTYKRRSRTRVKKGKACISLDAVKLVPSIVGNNHETDPSCQERHKCEPSGHEKGTMVEERPLADYSPFKGMKAQPHISNYIYIKPNVSQKNITSIIPDSFDDGQYVYGITKSGSHRCENDGCKMVDMKQELVKEDDFEEAVNEVHDAKCWRDHNIVKFPLSQLPNMSCPAMKGKDAFGKDNLVDPLHADVHSACNDFTSTVGCSVHSQKLQLEGKEIVPGKDNSPPYIYVKETLDSNRGLLPDPLKGTIFHPLRTSLTNNNPLSESIICRNISNMNPQTPQCNASEACNEAFEVGSTCEYADNKRISVFSAVKADERQEAVNILLKKPTLECSYTASPVMPRNGDIIKSVNEDIKESSFVDISVSLDIANGCDVHSRFCGAGKNDYDVLSDKESKYSSHLMESMQFAGSYFHPNPVLSINLVPKHNQLQLCVLCGSLEEDNRNLFVYVVPLPSAVGMSPLFIGYTSLVIPLRKNSFYRCASEKSALQVTPDGKLFVFIAGIKAPYCREKNVDCVCSKCKSDCFVNNAIRVVRVEFGFVSIVTNLVTNKVITCILVSDKKYLIAAEEAGSLHVWEMNQDWSASVEEFMLPHFDHKLSVILEMKNIPNCNSLIVGCDGQDGVGLWDVSKRILLGKFSFSGNTIFQILPVGLFRWQPIISIANNSEGEKHIKEAVQIDNWFFRAAETLHLSPAEDLSIWLLVASALDSNFQHDSKEPKSEVTGCWRLALALKSVVVVGSPLDNCATALDASADLGVIGTHEGLVYAWDLSSGKNLGNLHYFQGEQITCVSVERHSGVVAAASNSGQLVVYVKT